MSSSTRDIYIYIYIYIYICVRWMLLRTLLKRFIRDNLTQYRRQCASAKRLEDSRSSDVRLLVWEGYELLLWNSSWLRWKLTYLRKRGCFYVISQKYCIIVIKVATMNLRLVQESSYVEKIKPNIKDHKIDTIYFHMRWNSAIHHKYIYIYIY